MPVFSLTSASFHVILVKLPADHFSKSRKTKFWAGPRPAIHAAKVIGKNIAGVLLVALGIVLSLPGVPGQGLLTVLLGIMLLDFPGRASAGTEVVKQTEYREHDQPVARTVWKAAAPVKLRSIHRLHRFD